MPSRLLEKFTKPASGIERRNHDRAQMGPWPGAGSKHPGLFFAGQNMLALSLVSDVDQRVAALEWVAVDPAVPLGDVQEAA